MSEEQPKEPINYGDQVVLQKPKKPEDPPRSYSEPGLIIIILVIIFLLMFRSPAQPSSPPTATSPASTPTQTPSPTVTPEPLEGTATTSTPTSASSSHGCQEGIEVGKSVNVAYTGVRVRKSAGYVTKNDAQDTIHYLKAGNRAEVKAGPTEEDGLCWWKIEHDGFEGWTADHSSEGLLLLQASQ